MTATNKLLIFNQALAHLGEDPVDSLTPSTMPAAARKMTAFVESARSSILGAHHWTDAMRYVTLERAEVAGDWKYPYVYLLPDEALRVTEVNISDEAWEQGSMLIDAAEQRVIRSTFDGALPVAYIRLIDWEVLPAILATAIALRLAALAAVPIGGDEAREAKLEKRAVEAVAAAIGREGSQQGGQAPLFDDPYARLRASAG